MNSVERRELRYQRRKSKRIKDNVSLDCFCFSKVMHYADKCCKGVGYKKSTQFFKLHLFTIIANTCYNIKNNNYKVNKTYRFKINERGKTRIIDAPLINDRLVHKVLTNEVLCIYDRHFIYDNGASIKNKGFHFAIKRVKKILSKCNDGYVILIDFSKYFENCSHEIIKKIHRKYINNEYLIKVIEDYLFINKGLSLGIELAQKEALMIPNSLDHMVKYKIVRYMDDSIIFIDNYNDAVNLLNKYIIEAKKLNIKINKNKTKIIKNNEFVFCKWKFILNNKVIMIPIKKTIYRQRRKLNKLIKNNIVIDDIKTCYKAYLRLGNCYKYITYLDKYKN